MIYQCHKAVTDRSRRPWAIHVDQWYSMRESPPCSKSVINKGGIPHNFTLWTPKFFRLRRAGASKTLFLDVSGKNIGLINEDGIALITPHMF